MAERFPHLTGDALGEAVASAARCRSSNRHVLDPIPAPPDTPRPQFGAYLVQRCLHCGTLRYDHVNRYTGTRIGSPRYVRPSWYEDALAEGLDTEEWRLRFWVQLGDELFLEPEEVVVPIKRRSRKRA